MDLGRAEATADDMMELIWLEIAKAKYAEWEQAALPRIEKQWELRLALDFQVSVTSEICLSYSLFSHVHGYSLFSKHPCLTSK